MVYNFPGAASGIDLDSDFLIELSEHQNCFGAKVSTENISLYPYYHWHTDRLHISSLVQGSAKAIDYPLIHPQSHINNAIHNLTLSSPDFQIFSCLLL